MPKPKINPDQRAIEKAVKRIRHAIFEDAMFIKCSLHLDLMKSTGLCRLRIKAGRLPYYGRPLEAMSGRTIPTPRITFYAVPDLERKHWVVKDLELIVTTTTKLRTYLFNLYNENQPKRATLPPPKQARSSSWNCCGVRKEGRLLPKQSVDNDL